MRFDLHQNVRGLLMKIVTAGIVVGEVAPHRRSFHHRGIVFIGREHIVRRGFEGVFNHFKQRLRLRFTVDNPVGVKNLVAAVLEFARANMYSSISFGLRPSLVNASCK